jgi:hypothetical protein
MTSATCLPPHPMATYEGTCHHVTQHHGKVYTPAQTLLPGTLQDGLGGVYAATVQACVHPPCITEFQGLCHCLPSRVGYGSTTKPCWTHEQLHAD